MFYSTDDNPSRFCQETFRQSSGQNKDFERERAGFVPVSRGSYFEVEQPVPRRCRVFLCIFLEPHSSSTRRGNVSWSKSSSCLSVRRYVAFLGLRKVNDPAHCTIFHATACDYKSYRQCLVQLLCFKFMLKGTFNTQILRF